MTCVSLRRGLGRRGSVARSPTGSVRVGAVGDEIVVDEDGDVLAHRAGVVEHVAAYGREPLEVLVERTSHVAADHGDVGAVDVSTKCFGEDDLGHRTNCTPGLSHGSPQHFRSDRKCCAYGQVGAGTTRTGTGDMRTMSPRTEWWKRRSIQLRSWAETTIAAAPQLTASSIRASAGSPNRPTEVADAIPASSAACDATAAADSRGCRPRHARRRRVRNRRAPCPPGRRRRVASSGSGVPRGRTGSRRRARTERLLRLPLADHLRRRRRRSGWSMSSAWGTRYPATGGSKRCRPRSVEHRALRH